LVYRSLGVPEKPRPKPLLGPKGPRSLGKNGLGKVPIPGTEKLRKGNPSGHLGKKDREKVGAPRAKENWERPRIWNWDRLRCYRTGHRRVNTPRFPALGVAPLAGGEFRQGSGAEWLSRGPNPGLQLDWDLGVIPRGWFRGPRPPGKGKGLGTGHGDLRKAEEPGKDFLHLGLEPFRVIRAPGPKAPHRVYPSIWDPFRRGIPETWV